MNEPDQMDKSLRQLRSITEALIIQGKLRRSASATWVVVALAAVSVMLFWRVATYL